MSFNNFFLLEICIENLLTKIMRDNYMGKLYIVLDLQEFTVRNVTGKTILQGGQTKKI